MYIAGHGWVNSLLFQYIVSTKQEIKIKIKVVSYEKIKIITYLCLIKEYNTI
jgi:hypothetical protein